MPKIDLGYVIGPKGDKGDTGPQGVKGDPAKVNNVSPDASGNITIDYEDIGLKDTTTSTLDFLTRVSTNNYLAKIKKLEGKSVGVNQLLQSNGAGGSAATVTFTNNNDGSWTVNGTSTGTDWVYVNTSAASIKPSNHKFYITGITSKMFWKLLNTSTTSQTTVTSSSFIYTFNGGEYKIGMGVTNGQTENSKVYPMAIDLTLIFGSGSEPSTVDNLKSAWLTKFGYPLPTYIPYNSGSIVDCDIKGVGATGRNLLEPTLATTTTSGVTCTNNYDGTYTLNGTATATIQFKIINSFDVKKGETYRLVGCPSNGSGSTYRMWTNSSTAFPSSGRLFDSGEGSTQTAKADETVNIIIQVFSGVSCNNLVFKPMITADLSATYATFEPYSPYYRSFPIILRSAGTVKDTVEDCGSGYKVTRRVGTVDLGSLTWTTPTYSGILYAKSSGIASSVKTRAASVVYPITIASFTPTTYNAIGASKEIAFDTDGSIWLTDPNQTSSTFVNSLNGVYLNYELATPITEYHSYNLTYPVTLNGTEYFDSPISVPCEIEYGVDALTDIAQALTVSPTKWEEDIDEIKDFVGYNDDEIYGVEVDMENKIFTRLGKAVFMEHGKDFDEIAPWKRRRCNVADNGTVNAYYGDSGYKEDGSNGQVMVEQPAFWYKVVPLKLDPIANGRGFHLRKARYYISEYPRSGFKLHPAFIQNGVQKSKIYLSAYEGSTYDVSASAYNTTDAQTVDWSNDKLASIASAKPTSGLSQSGATRAGFRTIASKRGSGWSQATVQSATATELLFLVEYASFNTQTKLGIGVTNKSWTGANDSEITGATTTLGNKSGSVTNTNGYNVVSYRGEENPFGNIWKWIDGINVYNYGVGSVHIADNGFADNTKSAPYEDAGITICGAGGYVSAFAYNEVYDWLFIASECNGNDQLPVGDYFYQSKSENRYSAAQLGGYWNNGSGAGGFFWSVDDTSSYRNVYIGGRLLYIPQ